MLTAYVKETARYLENSVFKKHMPGKGTHVADVRVAGKIIAHVPFFPTGRVKQGSVKIVCT